MTALSLSDALPGGLTAGGGPGLGAWDVRSGLAAPAYAASIAWGAGVAVVIISLLGERESSLGPR